MSASSGSSRHSTTRPRPLTWVYQASPSSTVSETRPSRRIQATRARSASMFTSTRPSSSTRYHVATDMGWPSGMTTAITAGLGRRSSSRAAGGSGGVGTGLLRRGMTGCQDPGMQLREVIRRRRMVRAYQPDRPVPEDVVTRLLEHAIRAPSAGFSQGWDFVVLREAADRDLFWAVSTDAGREPDAWLRGLRTAPLLILCLSDKDAYLDRYAAPDKGCSDRDEARWPVPYWDVDTGMAALLVLLTVVDEGLAACFFGVQPDRHGPFREAFGVPDEYTPIGCISVGYPGDEDKRSPSLRRGRRGVEEVVHRGRW